MGQRIIDLDELVPESVEVKMAGKVYRLPGDIPVPDYLRIAKLWDSLQEEPEEDGDDPRLKQLYDVVLELFQREDPKLKEIPVGPKRLGLIVVTVFAGLTGEEQEPEGKARKAAGTKSTSRKKPAKSRSSR